jgi:pyruvate dehydrogenase complex dehydrogenase (E1) component
VNAATSILGRTDGNVDADPTETQEWIESLNSVIREESAERALYLLNELEEQMRRKLGGSARVARRRFRR